MPTDPPGRLAEIRDIHAAIKRQQKVVAAEDAKKAEETEEAEAAKKAEEEKMIEEKEEKAEVDKDTIVVDMRRKWAAGLTAGHERSREIDDPLCRKGTSLQPDV